MEGHDDALSLGITAADIAWPLVLALCIALIVLPFAFVIAAKWGGDPDDAPS
jgi:uncharacterized membrane protein